MAKGGLKPPKPRPTKEATLTDISDLLKPEVYERLGPIGTMNMLQTMATAAKIPEVTNVPALISEPVLPALAGEPAAQKKVQRRVSEAETGLESPKRREILKAARDVAGATMVPVPTSVKDVLISEVAKPALKAIPDSAIQAAIAAFLKPKLKPVQLERLGEKRYEALEADAEAYDSAVPEVSADEIANFANLPVEDVQNYLTRSKVDIADTLTGLSDQFFNYKAYRDGTFDRMNMEDILGFTSVADRRGWEDSPFELAARNFTKRHPEKGRTYTEDDFNDMFSDVYERFFEDVHGNSLKNLAALVGDEEASEIGKSLRQRFDDVDPDDELISLRDMLDEYLDVAGYVPADE